MSGDSSLVQIRRRSRRFHLRGFCFPRRAVEKIEVIDKLDGFDCKDSNDAVRPLQRWRWPRASRPQSAGLPDHLKLPSSIEKRVARAVSAVIEDHECHDGRSRRVKRDPDDSADA